MAEEYRHWFATVTGFSAGPHLWQQRLADDPICRSRLIRIPTGLGKTEGVLGAWLYHALGPAFQPDASQRHHEQPHEPAGDRNHQPGTAEVRSDWPRRLVWCLPMRVLVEQTAERARRMIDRWAEAFGRSDKPQVYILMGGEEADDWAFRPEQHAILIGTQDMLLSRALNRGYGMSRYRWPIHFGLLNNDCLWVFDEVQLMDVGVATGAQLEAFRRKLGSVFPARSIWMSATLDRRWLQTVDVDANWFGEPLELTEQEKEQGPVADRYRAPKRLLKASALMGEDAEIAEQIAAVHQPKTLTLAVFNTVARARAVYERLQKLQSNKKDVALSHDVLLLLIHSRFRPPEREEKVKQLLAELPPAGTIAVTTQVVEAGVDVSAKTLFTELAPWASLVQRFGRCNRHGEFQIEDPGQVFWIDVPDDQKAQQALAAPYDLHELLEARKALAKCQDVGPQSLEAVRLPLRLEVEHLLRRRDFVDLFDTTPDLAGNDIDVSRFIRSGDEIDVQVFWRDVPKEMREPKTGADYAAAPRREELCAVPVYEFRDFVRKHQDNVWRWDGLQERWLRVDDEHVFAGQTFLVRAAAGGYNSELGWDAKQKEPVQPIPPVAAVPEAYDDDRYSVISKWQTVAEHAEELYSAMQHVIGELGLASQWANLLLLAARWHDYGKAHPVFQQAIPDDAPQPSTELAIWSKAPGAWKRYPRKHFRHELASALGILQQPHAALQSLSQDELSLLAFLVAAHHGKVRLSIRSLPGEQTPEEPDRLYARGVWDGDELPQVDLGAGIAVGPIRLSLQPMQLGRGPNGEPSWAERMVALRDSQQLGPLRLAFFEAVLRAIDMRVSRAATQAVEAESES